MEFSANDKFPGVLVIATNTPDVPVVPGKTLTMNAGDHRALTHGDGTVHLIKVNLGISNLSTAGDYFHKEMADGSLLSGEAGNMYLKYPGGSQKTFCVAVHKDGNTYWPGLHDIVGNTGYFLETILPWLGDDQYLGDYVRKEAMLEYIEAAPPLIPKAEIQKFVRGQFANS